MVQHRQRNIIFSLKNEGVRQTQDEDMEENLVRYFKDLLTEPHMERKDAVHRMYNQIPNMITRDQNIALMRETKIEEVKQVVKGLKK